MGVNNAADRLGGRTGRSDGNCHRVNESVIHGRGPAAFRVGLIQRRKVLLIAGFAGLAVGGLCVLGVEQAQSRRSAAIAALIADLNSTAMPDEQRSALLQALWKEHPDRNELEYLWLCGWGLGASGLALAGLGCWSAIRNRHR